jgi:hypothetical protein
VRAECDESSRLLPAVSLQDPLYCRLEIVEPNAVNLAISG